MNHRVSLTEEAGNTEPAIPLYGEEYKVDLMLDYHADRLRY